MKFTESGEIQVRAVYADDTLRVAVTDTGVGIPKGLLDLFERTTWPVAAVGERAVGPSQPPRVDVAERLREMWR